MKILANIIDSTGRFRGSYKLHKFKNEYRWVFIRGTPNLIAKNLVKNVMDSEWRIMESYLPHLTYPFSEGDLNED